MIRIGDKFYDAKEGRYITTDGQGCDPRCWSCIVEEANEEGEFEVTGRQLFMESELKKFERR